MSRETYTDGRCLVMNDTTINANHILYINLLRAAQQLEKIRLPEVLKGPTTCIVERVGLR